MFKELKDLIDARPLTLTVVGLTGNRLRVCVIPQPLESDKDVNAKAGHHKEVAKIPEGAVKALTTPLCLEGTAEELDAEMPEQLRQFSTAHGELRNTIDAAKQQIADAVKTIEERDKLKAKEKQAAAKAGTNKDGKDKPRDRNSHESASLPLEWTAPPATNSDPDQTAVADTRGEQEPQC
jgi:PRTRC genetic system protein E